MTGEALYIGHSTRGTIVTLAIEQVKGCAVYPVRAQKAAAHGSARLPTTAPGAAGPHVEAVYGVVYGDLTTWAWPIEVAKAFRKVADTRLSDYLIYNGAVKTKTSHCSPSPWLLVRAQPAFAIQFNIVRIETPGSIRVRVTTAGTQMHSNLYILGPSFLSSGALLCSRALASLC